MPVWKGNVELALSTAKSLSIYEPDVKIVFSYQEKDKQKSLEDYGKVLYGGASGWGNAGQRFIEQMNQLLSKK